jgi:hypothetical protein
MQMQVHEEAVKRAVGDGVQGVRLVKSTIGQWS